MMTEEWMNTHKWQATKKRILTTLFYSIWNQRYALQLSSKQTLLPTHIRSKEKAFANRMPQDLIRPQSRDFEPEKHSTQAHAQPLKFLGKIDHRGINNWETLLARYLRSKLWEVCRKEEILLSEYITSTSGHSRLCILLFTTDLS